MPYNSSKQCLEFISRISACQRVTIYPEFHHTECLCTMISEICVITKSSCSLQGNEGIQRQPRFNILQSCLQTCSSLEQLPFYKLLGSFQNQLCLSSLLEPQRKMYLFNLKLYASQSNKFQPNKQYIFETLSKNQAGMPTAHNKLLLLLYTLNLNNPALQGRYQCQCDCVNMFKCQVQKPKH